MLILAKLSSAAIPMTGIVGPLCFKVIHVPGWSGLLVFLMTSGILPR